MARADRTGGTRNDTRLDAPKGLRTSLLTSRFPPVPPSPGIRFGRFTEWIARAMGTPMFILVLTIFVIIWIFWNSYLPNSIRFDSAALGFTALTLVLSLQASYAAPLILLAQNRQDDRDRVQIEQDRQRAERNLADTEYLAREVVALRLAVREMASKDFIRAELRAVLDELEKRDDDGARRASLPRAPERGRVRTIGFAGARGAQPRARPRDPSSHRGARDARERVRGWGGPGERRGEAHDRRMPGIRHH